MLLCRVNWASCHDLPPRGFATRKGKCRGYHAGSDTSTILPKVQSYILSTVSAARCKSEAPNTRVYSEHIRLPASPCQVLWNSHLCMSASIKTHLR
jgi:hypothetical protein